MTDIVDAVTRSRMMRGIRAKDTKPERIVRSILHAEGFRYRLHDKRLPGTPDIVLPMYRAVIFVSGCFWHGHDCHLFRWPATRPEFWKEKIGRNQLNDAKAREALSGARWRHGTVWECALRSRNPAVTIEAGKRLVDWIRSDEELFVLRGNP